MSTTTKPGGPVDADTDLAIDVKGDRYLTPAEAAAYLHISKSLLDKLRVYGGGPTFCAPTKRKILYEKSELDAWMRRRRFNATREYEQNEGDDEGKK